MEQRGRCARAGRASPEQRVRRTVQTRSAQATCGADSGSLGPHSSGRGDRSTWDLLCAKFRAPSCRAAAVMVGPSEAEEVVQDAFEGAMREKDFLDSVPEPVAGSDGSRHGWRSCVFAAGRSGNAAPAWSGTPARSRSHPASQRLPWKQHGAVVLRYYLRADFADIAATRGLSEASVAKHSRGRAALRKDLL